MPCGVSLSALYYSFLSYLVLGIVAVVALGATTHDISRLWHGHAKAAAYLALAAGGVVIPMTLAELARWWTGSRVRRRIGEVAGLSPSHTTPSGWEHFFLRDRTCLVRVTLNDGRVVGGRYGEHSFAGYTAETPDLYLQERWVLDPDDWFAEPVAGSLGVYVRAGEIVSVEFYDDGELRLPAPKWWLRLKYLLPWVRLPSYNFDRGSQFATPSSDQKDRRDQSVAEGAQTDRSAGPSERFGNISSSEPGDEPSEA